MSVVASAGFGTPSELSAFSAVSVCGDGVVDLLSLEFASVCPPIWLLLVDLFLPLERCQ